MTKSVGIEEESGDKEADGQLEFGRGDGWCVAAEAVDGRKRETIVESGKAWLTSMFGGGQQRDEETEAAEENFAGKTPAEDEHLASASQMTAVSMPEYLKGMAAMRRIMAMVDRIDEGDAAAARWQGKLGEGEFETAPRRRRLRIKQFGRGQD